MVRFYSLQHYEFIFAGKKKKQLILNMDKLAATKCSSCLFQSEGSLPAQRGAPEPTGEKRGQLFTAAVPRWRPHLERSSQRPAFQTDGGQLLSQLPETKSLPGTYRRWWRRRQLNTWNWLSRDSVPSYKSLWLGVRGAGAQKWGPHISRHTSGNSNHLVYDFQCWHRDIFHCMSFASYS